MAPTGSTFGLKTTSKNVCANLAGKYNLEGGAHSHTAAAAIFGQAKGTLKPDSTAWTKKGTGNPVLIDKKEGKSTTHLYVSGQVRTIGRKEACNPGQGR